MGPNGQRDALAERVAQRPFREASAVPARLSLVSMPGVVHMTCTRISCCRTATRLAEAWQTSSRW